MTTVQEHNATTGEVVVRPMTDEEIAQAELDRASIEALKEAQIAADLAKETAQAKLAALGLTTDDLKALGLGTN
jgi:hypothetical protein